MIKTNKRGCLIVAILIVLFAGIYFYFGRASDEAAPSPSQGSLPPPTDASRPQPEGKQPMRPLPSDPPG